MLTKLMGDVSCGTARGHLLVEPWEGVGGNRGAVEGRECEDGQGCIHAIVGFIADTGSKDATDLGGSLLFFYEVNEADGYWQSTSITD